MHGTWKSGKNQGDFSGLTNRIAPQLIALKNSSNPRKVR